MNEAYISLLHTPYSELSKRSNRWFVQSIICVFLFFFFFIPLRPILSAHNVIEFKFHVKYAWANDIKLSTRAN